jgi:hypothetical protein
VIRRPTLRDDPIVQRRAARVALTALVFLAGPADAVDLSDLSEYVTPTLSERVRGEFTDWFRPPAGAAPAARSATTSSPASSAPASASRCRACSSSLEMQDTRLVGLPDDASLAPPIGNLGPGATYFANTHQTDQASRS